MLIQVRSNDFIVDYGGEFSFFCPSPSCKNKNIINFGKKNKFQSVFALAADSHRTASLS